MEIRFIGQGLDPASDITAGNLIMDSLVNPAFQSFRAFVAFVSLSGLRNLLDQIAEFRGNGGNIRLFIGVDLNSTSKEALEKILELGIECYIVHSPNGIVYHPKIYTFEGEAENRAIIGSSNLTASGLFQNIEASVCVDFNSSDEDGNEFLSSIYDHFNSIINIQHESCHKLTAELLALLVATKTVMTEAAVRAKTNAIQKEFAKKDVVAQTQLNTIFGKIRAKRPPKGYTKSITKKELEVPEEGGEIVVVEQVSDVQAGAMWIETGQMTGGSRNILDLSKKGKLDGEIKFGSVSFFGVDPEDSDNTKNIDIIFGGKRYPNNLIFYAPANSNWRLRINGTADDDTKITTFSIPTLGQNGGFQHTILLFTKIEGDTYKLEVLDKGELPKLIENSADWARGGHGAGRAYGITR